MYVWYVMMLYLRAPPCPSLLITCRALITSIISQITHHISNLPGKNNLLGNKQSHQHLPSYYVLCTMGDMALIMKTFRGAHFKIWVSWKRTNDQSFYYSKNKINWNLAAFNVQFFRTSDLGSLTWGSQQYILLIFMHINSNIMWLI